MIPALLALTVLPVGPIYWVQDGRVCIASLSMSQGSPHQVIVGCFEPTPEFRAAEPAVTEEWIAVANPVPAGVSPYIAIWDTNKDNRLDIADVLTVVTASLAGGRCVAATWTCWEDVTQDRRVDIADVILMARALLDAP